MGWTPNELPALNGKTYVITGGNSGLGLEAAKILTGKGARVVFTARSEAKAKEAVAQIKAAHADADVDSVLMDLADLASVKQGAAEIAKKCPKIDALINNAGVMQTPRQETKDGFELQLGTNHLGHFKLNSLLLPLLERSGGRIVAVSSIAHRFGRIDVNDLNFKTRSYDPTTAYGQSKLANLMYSFELQRRLAARKSPVTAYASHPGYSATNLQSAGVGMEGGSKLLRALYGVTNAVLAQSAEKGAWPLVLAAADSKAEPGAYYGPTALAQTRGPVGKSAIARHARDEAVAKALWEKSEELVGPFFQG